MERYKHLNAEFQRIARRDKKAFLSDQCKKIEENNRMGKTRDLFKRDTKGTYHAKMGSIKDRNGMDLTEAEDIKKWQEYTGELYKKEFHDLDNHDGVITHLEPDILECEVKWASESITGTKLVEVMEFRLGSSEVKASASNAGDPGLIPGSGRSPGEGNVTHSRILAWRIPWTEEPGSPRGRKESDTTERLHSLHSLIS